MKILVTGAGGFIGSRICHELIKKHTIVGVFFHEKKRLNDIQRHPRFRMVSCDLTNRSRTKSIVRKSRAEAVIHAAALYSETIQEPEPYFQANVIATWSLMEACRSSQVKRFVLSSTMSVYKKPPLTLPVSEEATTFGGSHYAATKLMSEDIVRWYASSHGISSVILRYSGVYGPGRNTGAVSTFYQHALQNKPMHIESNLRWDIVHVDDVVAANVAAIRHRFRLPVSLYNIGSGEEITVLNVARRIVRLLGSTSAVRRPANSHNSRFYLDIRRARKELGFRPLSISDGLALYAQQMRGAYI